MANEATEPKNWSQKSTDLIRSKSVFQRFQKYKNEILINITVLLCMHIYKAF
ncbi:hypothetical protein LCGC14_2252740 [marine sediment metagenome]|uniref:Uncharacterized protein n=1 Tax=marine sediment metagenome TaxID=412755 RepID=A0A0F9FEI9_9ZZZZ